MTIVRENNLQPSGDTSMHLIKLGWSSFFSKQLDDKDPEWIPARVTGIRKNSLLVCCHGREMQATIAGKLFNEGKIHIPAVGDWVLLRNAVIQSILIRKNALTRKESGGKSKKNGNTNMADQVIAANLDTVFIVCGLDRDFNLRRIERYLTLAYNCRIDPVIILTKADLHHDPETFTRQVEAVAPGVPVYLVSANDRNSVQNISVLVTEGRTAVLIGSSGAGKSTLINRLTGTHIRKTGQLGSKLGKGKHTTTTRDLIVLPSGGMVVDNPGIREIALALGEDGTISAFPDIEELAVSCRFDDCTHSHEPGCHVLEGVSAGTITLKRYQHYLKLKKEISYLDQMETKGASRVERQRWKSISQKIKCIKKR